MKTTIPGGLENKPQTLTDKVSCRVIFNFASLTPHGGPRIEAKLPGKVILASLLFQMCNQNFTVLIFLSSSQFKGPTKSSTLFASLLVCWQLMLSVVEHRLPERWETKNWEKTKLKVKDKKNFVEVKLTKVLHASNNEVSDY